MPTIKTLISIILLGAAICSCTKKDEPIPPPGPVQTADRTVLVYMVATNNLGTGNFDGADIREMRKFADSGGLNNGRLIVYHASTKGVVLKEIKAGGIDTLKVYDKETLSVSINRMREVISDTKRLAPARDYGMVLWSHASGWLQDGIQDTAAKYSYGVDGTTNGKKMNITSFAEATYDAGFSFMYFDCCYMGTVEVAYEIRDCAPYIVLSPAEDPADGMPYDLTLPHLFDTSSPIEDIVVNAASTTFDYYNNTFKKGDCPCTLTVVKTAALEDLAQAAAKIYDRSEYTYNPEYDYQRYQTGTICYYYDLDQYVESICEDPDLLANWRNALAEAVVYHASTPWIWSSIPILRCSGLSTYILATESSAATKGYNTTSWYEDVACRLFR